MLPGKKLIMRTGQIYKLRLGYTMLFSGAGAIYLFRASIENMDPNLAFLVVLLGLGIGLAGMIYPCISIKCPTCQAKWLWLMASTNVDDPKHWDMKHEVCNLCGETGSENT